MSLEASGTHMTSQFLRTKVQVNENTLSHMTDYTLVLAMLIPSSIDKAETKFQNIHDHHIRTVLSVSH